MKNSFSVENEKIEFRRAKKEDNLSEIAELIYKTDPYIYPFWFETLSEAKQVLSHNIKKDGFIFNYNNIYVAHDKTTQHIIGLVCALDNSINYNFDYTQLKQVNDNYKITIEKYIEIVLEEVQKSNRMYLSNVCIQENYRGKKIGSKLLGYFISQMEKQGFDEFELDCLLHNLRAKNLYHSFSFKEMRLIVGFDGTDNSKVEVVSMKRLKGTYLPSEFDANNVISFIQ